MKRSLVSALFAMGLLHATNTRLITMGGFGDYLIDDANIETYPTQAYFFPNTVVGELGSGDFEKSSFRINLLVGDEGRFGSFYLCANKSPSDPLSHRLSGIYPIDPGLDMGYFYRKGHLLLGAHTGYMGSYSDANDSLIRADIGYGRLGIGWLMQGQPTEVSLAYYNISGRNDPAGASLAGGSALDLRARSLFPISDQTAVVAALQYHDDKLKDNIIDPNDYREIGARIGFNTTPVKGYTLVMGLNYWEYREHIADTSTDFQGLSATTGLDAKIASFLNIRVGASKYFWGVRETNGTKERIYSFFYNFGLGLMFDELEIDGHIKNDILFSGPYFIGGESPGMFSQVSVKYHFRTF